MRTSLHPRGTATQVRHPFPWSTSGVVGLAPAMVVRIGVASEFFNIVQRLGMAVGGLLLVLFKRGPAAARNLGWRSTASPSMALTDDDCVPHRDLLRQAPSSARVMAGMLHASIRNCTLVL